MLNVSFAVKSSRKEALIVIKENAKKSNLNVITWESSYIMYILIKNAFLFE